MNHYIVKTAKLEAGELLTLDNGCAVLVLPDAIYHYRSESDALRKALPWCCSFAGMPEHLKDLRAVAELRQHTACRTIEIATSACFTGGILGNDLHSAGKVVRVIETLASMLDDDSKIGPNDCARIALNIIEPSINAAV